MLPFEAWLWSHTEDMPLRRQEVTYSTDAAECRQIRSLMNTEYGEFKTPSLRQAYTESRYSGKLGCTVRRGVVGKVLRSNSLATHPILGRAAISTNLTDSTMHERSTKLENGARAM